MHTQGWSNLAMPPYVFGYISHYISSRSVLHFSKHGRAYASASTSQPTCMPLGTVIRYVFAALRRYCCGIHNDDRRSRHSRRC